MKTTIIKTALISSFLLGGMLEADTPTSQDSFSLADIVTESTNKSLQDTLNSLKKEESALDTKTTNLENELKRSLATLSELNKASATSQGLVNLQVELKRIYDDKDKSTTLDKTQKVKLEQLSAAIINARSAFDKASEAKEVIKNSMDTYTQTLNELSDTVAQITSQQALIKIRENVLDSIDQTQSSLASLSNAHKNNVQMLDFVSSLNTQTRLAKLSNPHYQDTYFAQWVESIKNQALAANNTLAALPNTKKASKKYSRGDLSLAIIGYDKFRLNKTQNIWANLGSIAGVNQGVNNVSATLSVGYDAFISHMILGMYGTYAYTTDSISSTSSKNQSHNGDFGIYTRFFLGQNEIDLTLGENIGYTMIHLENLISDSTLSGNSTGFQTHIDLAYGYVFDISQGWYVKPFVGLGYNYGYNTKMQANTQDPISLDALNTSMSISPYQTHFGSVSVGLEFRKYFNDNNAYFFVTPSFYQGVLFYNDEVLQTKIYETSFVKNYSDFKSNRLDSSFVLKAGGEVKAGNNFYINASLGLKAGNISRYGVVNIGTRWMF